MKAVILDCGHNYSDTWQKFSPIKENGKRFYEYQFNRAIGRLVAEKLDRAGIKHYWTINPEDNRDMSLSKRVEMANAIARGEGKSDVLFVSLHANALGKGDKWYDTARGWSVYTSKGATKSDQFATIFFEVANKVLPKYGMTVRKDMSDGDPDYEENFYVLKNTICPAILLEQLFYTSHKDLEFMESDKGKDVLSDIIVEALKKIFGKQ